MSAPPEREERWRAWREAAHDASVGALLDLAVGAARAAGDVAVLQRALTVVPVHLVTPADGLATSVADATTYVHAWTSPLRATTVFDAATEEVSIDELLAPELVASVTAPCGLRLDPGLPGEIHLDPDQVVELLATAAGAATRAALTAVPGEDLVARRGPAEVVALTDDALAVGRDLLAALAPVARVLVLVDGEPAALRETLAVSDEVWLPLR